MSFPDGMDCIHIAGLEVNAVIGTLPHERTWPQPLILHADLFGDFRAAAAVDNFRATFDYSAVEAYLVKTASASSFQLLEALAEHLAAGVLNLSPFLRAVRLRIVKPRASAFHAEISIEIERVRSRGPESSTAL